MQVSELLTELRHFYCTQNYYRHWLKCLVYTDGVKFLADEANCYWLVDAIASHQPEIKRISQLRQHRVFQTWRLELDPKPMMLSCFDGQCCSRSPNPTGGCLY